MKMRTPHVIAALLLALIATPAAATGQASYAPANVVYDLTTAEPAKLANILDRVSMLQNLYGNDPFAASIVVVIHGGAIPLLAKGGRIYHPALASRAQDLAVGGMIQFRLCAASAKMQGYGQGDFEGFIELVPMADAEIIRLQSDGYAYLH